MMNGGNSPSDVFHLHAALTCPSLREDPRSLHGSPSVSGRKEVSAAKEEEEAESLHEEEPEEVSQVSAGVPQESADGEELTPEASSWKNNVASST